jgi:hypothetical protein
LVLGSAGNKFAGRCKFSTVRGPLLKSRRFTPDLFQVAQDIHLNRRWFLRTHPRDHGINRGSYA